MRSMTPSEEILRSLIHDLRQPLGNIETSLFCLDLVLDHPSGRIREQLRTMEHQIAQTTELLQHAADELSSRHAQRGADKGAAPSAVAVESFDLTNSTTAGVT